MDLFEQMVINMLLGILQQVVKNPAKKVALQVLLFHVADSIYETYAVTPPTHP